MQFVALARIVHIDLCQQYRKISCHVFYLSKSIQQLPVLKNYRFNTGSKVGFINRVHNYKLKTNNFLHYLFTLSRNSQNVQKKTIEKTSLIKFASIVILFFLFIIRCELMLEYSFVNCEKGPVLYYNGNVKVFFVIYILRVFKRFEQFCKQLYGILRQILERTDQRSC